MSGYTMAVTLDRPYDDTVTAVREALKDQGFGVLTEIESHGILLDTPFLAKLSVEMAGQLAYPFRK